MKDFLFVSVCVGREKFAELERLLEEINLLREVKLDNMSALTGSCDFRLPKDDPRVWNFLNRVKDENLAGNPFIRADREYSKQDIDRASWLICSIKTVGLRNPSDDQLFDRSKSCPLCGSNTVPVEPLKIPVNEMGKKMIDRTLHNGWLIVKRIIAEKIQEVKLTGIEFHKAVVGRDEENYLWAIVTNILPPMHTKSIFEKNIRCVSCGKGGYYGLVSQANEYWFDTNALVNGKLEDFNLTYEYFGTAHEYFRSKLGDNSKGIEECGRKLGGAQFLMVSQKVRQFLEKEKVKWLNFEPIFVV